MTEIVYSDIKKNLMNDPKYARKIAIFKVKEVYKDEFYANTSPSCFVGSKLPYPFVNVGILSPPEKKEDIWLYDAQKYWADNNFDIQRILELRSSLINSRFKTDVVSARKEDNRFVGMVREVGMSIKPVDTEVKLKKKIKLRLHFDDTSLPMGSRGNLTKLKIGNTKIPQHIDKVYFDTDLKAVDCIKYLSKHKYDEQRLSQLLSIGIMGQKKRRVFVPTRFSITAIDSILGNELLKKIKDFSVIAEYQFFYGHYLGNHYFILFFPEMYNYELFETYLPGSFWNPTTKINMGIDFEPFKGRTKYAEQTAGGFYATRIGMLEYLSGIRRQGAVLVVRIETPEYTIGLGVFVVRESIRKTLRNKPLIFDEKSKALDFFKKQIFDKFKLDLGETLKKSQLLEAIKQKKLMDF